MLDSDITIWESDAKAMELKDYPGMRTFLEGTK